MLPLCFPKKLEELFNASAWTWITLVYAGQAVGSVLFAWCFSLDFDTLIFPLGLLFFGTLIAWCFRGLETRRALSSWHWWVPGIIYAIFIFLLSNESFNDVSIPVNTNSFHPVEYFTLGIFLCWGWYPVLKKRGEWVLARRVLLTGFAYGVLDELHQSFVPGRYPSLVDLLLDLLGLSAGVTIFVLAGYFQKNLKRRTS